MQTYSLLTTLLFLGILAPSGDAYARTGEGPCKKDVARLCKDVAPGQGRIRACLSSRQGELSPECKARTQAKQEKRGRQKSAFKAACGNDVKQLCAEVKPGEGRIRQCLRTQKEKLSSSCQKFRQKASEAKKQLKKACREDQDKLCPNIHGGFGKKIGCLKRNSPKLSDTCRQALKAHHRSTKMARRTPQRR